MSPYKYLIYKSHHILTFEIFFFGPGDGSWWGGKTGGGGEREGHERDSGGDEYDYGDRGALHDDDDDDYRDHQALEQNYID